MQNIDHLCMGCMSDNGGEQICSVCGFDQSKYDVENALPLRKVLAGRYIIGKVVSANGEGFTYIGMDTVTDSVVKITEYFPTGLCYRLADGSLEIGEDSSYVFNNGIIQFISLHKKLAAMTDVSAIYRVIDIFEINKTAYCISEYLPGISLKEFLIRNGNMLTWEQVRPLFLPLIASFKQLHNNDIVHGGISPETLLVGRDGRIRIVDFTIPAIRNARSEMTAQLFPGFAAIEQYRGDALSPATDVYGFAATMFRTLTGNPPPDSKRRLELDNLTFPRSIAEQMPRSVLVAMANALQIEAANRTATMADLKDDLQPAEAAPIPTPVPATASGYGAASVQNTPPAPRKKGNTIKYVAISALVTALIFSIIGVLVYIAFFKEEETVESSSSKLVTSYESQKDAPVSSEGVKQEIVPDLRNKTYEEAVALCGDLFKVVVSTNPEPSDQYEKGKICRQEPQPDTNLVKGGEIKIYISNGSSKRIVPSEILGKTKAEAQKILQEKGFYNITFMEKLSDTETGSEIVFDTNPGIGKEMEYYETLIVYHTPYKEEPIVEEETDTENSDEDSDISWEEY